jgi:hypothetical protein
LYQGTYNISWHIKYINQRYYNIVYEGTYGVARFDILNGVVDTFYNGPNLTRISAASITPAPNGYYRINATLNVTESVINFARINLWPGVWSSNNYSGSQAYVWGAQLSRTSYATPYVSSSSTVLGARTSWRDLSGNNNLATLQSSSISGSIPVFPASNDRVLQFDGTSSFASIPNSSNLVFGNGDFTVGMWIKTPISSVGEGSPSQWGPIISKGCTTSAPAGTWWFAQNSTLNNSITFNASATSSGTFVCSLNTNALSDGWHNIVVTRVGITTYLYTDGTLTRTDTSSGSDLSSTAPLWIASTSAQTPKKTSMTLSQVQIYNRGLSATEIQQNFNALRGRYGI